MTGPAISAAGGVVHWLDAPGGIRLRAAHFPDGDRGTVLLMHGRTEFIEKYLEPIAEWQSRGFSVWTMDWRGQGLSSRLLPNPLPHHVGRFEDYLDDADLLLDRHVLPGLADRPLLLMAHSMGGNIAARLLARRPGLFDRAVLCAPMIDFLRGGPMARRLTRLLIRAMCVVPGRAERMGPGARIQSILDTPFAGNRLTTSPERYAADIQWLRDTPALVVGGVTWGWLCAAVASVQALRPEALTMPVLVALAGDERIVDNAAIRAFAARLPQGTLLEVAGAQHELLRERDGGRLALWAAIDRMLA
jgi:lysophospholipase